MLNANALLTELTVEQFQWTILIDRKRNIFKIEI